jgi:hypothetical protein
MSYDILVFDPAYAPREREAFHQWWDAQADWSEPHPYNDPAFTTSSLRAWFMEMIESFPALMDRTLLHAIGERPTIVLAIT